MKINIVGRKVTLRDHFKDLATKKLSKFDKIFEDDAEAAVVVTVEKNRQTVEIAIKSRGMIYRAEATENEMNDALDRVVVALSSQIRRNKTKLERAKKLQPGITFEEFENTPLAAEEEEEHNVVKTKEFFVSVMTPEEAILQMNMLNHAFFMFREDTTGDINVVYRRKNGDYGLLVPER